jgi:hypothetical protein
MSWRVNRSKGRFLLLLLVALALLAGPGCGDDDRDDRAAKRVGGVTKKQPAPLIEGKKVPVGQNVYLEVLPNGQRRVLISSRICLRQGPIEQLLTRRGTKEHEAILTANIDARKVHEALLLAGAKPGSTVRFEPTFRPPSGTPIKVSLIYEQGNEKITVDARKWVRDMNTGKELECDWVFAGSILDENPNPLDPKAPKKYYANDGDVICVANFPTALLDVPIRSNRSWAERHYEAWTERIPKEAPSKKGRTDTNKDQSDNAAADEDERTVVVVVLEPVLPKQGAKKPAK